MIICRCSIDRTFQKSSNSNEKKLYKYLKDELYPAVMPIVKVCLP